LTPLRQNASPEGTEEEERHSLQQFEGEDHDAQQAANTSSMTSANIMPDLAGAH
ncbi:unnamed protein product, partial [Amoebophrya sp. A120]